MIAVWVCVAAWLLDLFDRFERRFAKDLMRYQMLPDRWVAWGLLDPGQTTHWVRYFMVKLPSYSWEYRPWNLEYGWSQRALLYVGGRGWRVHFIPQ